MKKRVLVISSLISLLFVSAIASVTSFAWFSGRDTVITNGKLGGSVLQSYFHAGNGSATKPFTITTPWHYENFVKLHYNVEGFSAKGYYFEFGDLILDSPTPIFYATDSKGVVDRKNTSTTLDLGGMELPPLGTSEQPFFAQLDGNGLTVSHFTVNGKGYSDIGIFGFVDEAINPAGETQRAYVHNCYWSDFVINTKNSDKSAHTHTKTASLHNDNTEVGYLAGHVVEAAAFEDCYVNNCEVKGTSPADAQNTSYGYYGKAEKDAIGGETGKGSNYKFLLDSEAIYRSVRNKYDNVANFENSPIRARTETVSGQKVKYTEYDTPINNDYNEIVDNKTKYPITSAISQDGRQYNLNGASRDVSADRNYSFSTIGYQPLTSDSKTYEYEAKYKDGNEYVEMPDSTTRNTSFDGSGPQIDVKDSFNTINYSGDWIYRNSNENNQWKYVHSENTATEGTSAKEFTINLSTNSEYTISGYGALNKPTVTSADFYLYIDGVQKSHQNLYGTVKAERTGWATQLHVYNIKLSQTTVNVDLCRGRHYYIWFLAVRCNTTQGKYTWLYNSNNKISCTTGGRLSATAGEFTVTQDMYDAERASRSISFNCTKSDAASNSDSGNPIELYSIDKRSHDPSSDIPPYVNSNTYQTNLYGIDLDNPKNIILLQGSDYNWIKDSGYSLEGEYWYRWRAYKTPSLSVDYDAATVYLADDPDIRPHTEGTTYVPGYEWRNIDIVGGGISFYYRNFPLLGFDIRVISIKSENSSNYVVNNIPTADINSNARFYATKYCPCSIVLYLKNTANAADEKEHTLGEISFQYVNLESGGSSRINLSKPCFKKGGGTFIDLTEFGTEVPGGGTVDYRTTFKCSITESGAKQCCYCALDKNGNILGVFDSSGKPSTGLVDGSGNPILEKMLAIDTYVLTLGTTSSPLLNLNTWVTKINFEYKAKEGYGGTFGSVGYRSASDTIDSTILNIYYNVQQLVYDPSKTINFSIKVKYENISEGDYVGKYTITATSDVTFTCNVFNYNTTSYYIVFNGQTMTSSDATFTIGP